jgi:hypothetical protein
MNNSTTYSWQAAYQCALLETDSTRIASRIDEALRAIPDRFSSTIQIGNKKMQLSNLSNLLETRSLFSEANGSAAYRNP